MTKGPLKRISERILDEDGSLEGGGRVIHLALGARLEVTDFVRESRHLRLSIRNWWFTKRALDELIAELLFIKEEIDNHPYFLEREQEEDQEEITEEELEEMELDWDEGIDEPEPPEEEVEENPFEPVAPEQLVQNELRRMALNRVVFPPRPLPPGHIYEDND